MSGGGGSLQREVRRLRLDCLVANLIHPISLLLNFGMLLAVVGALVTLPELWREPSLATAASAAILTAAAVWLSWIRISGLWHCIAARPRVVPYFQTRLGAHDKPYTSGAFEHGFGLGDKMAALDAAASERGVAQPSEFGFSDEPKRWWDARDGLRTLDAIAGLVADSDELGQDLAALRSALEKADEKEIRFALLVRLGPDDFISLYEMDTRKGSFW
jgi:hypothetical protein